MCDETIILTETETSYWKLNFPKPKPRLYFKTRVSILIPKPFFRDQIFQNKYRNLFSETFFFLNRSRDSKKNVYSWDRYWIPVYTGQDRYKSICWWTFLFSREGTPIPYPNNRISTARAKKNLHFSSLYNKWKHDYYSAGCFSPDLKMGNKGWFKNIFSPIFPRELLFFTKKRVRDWKGHIYRNKNSTCWFDLVIWCGRFGLVDLFW